MPLVKKTPVAAGPVEDGFPAAAARLQSAKPEDRWEAARQLGGWPDAVDALAGRLQGEPDQHVREAILTSLARINTAESFAAALGCLRADDASLRTAALDALKLMPRLAGARLDALLHDPDPDIRVLACDLARAAPPAMAAESLAAILTNETQVNVCAAAIDLLAEIGTPGILPQLHACAARFSEPFLDFSVTSAAAEIGARSQQNE